MEAKFRMDCYGSFQVEVDGVAGDVSHYEGVAMVEIGGKTYMGFSDYHSGASTFKAGQVYQVTEVPTEVGHSKVCNLFIPERACIHLEVRPPDEIVV